MAVVINGTASRSRTACKRPYMRAQELRCWVYNNVNGNEMHVRRTPPDAGKRWCPSDDERQDERRR